MSMVKPTFKHVLATLALAFFVGAPVWADDARVDDLFQQLANADENDYARIQQQILAEWSKSGSPTVDLLFRRGQDALRSGDLTAAVEHFSAAIDHAPDFTEAYNGRATAYYLLDEYGPSLEDIRQTLVRNPRHFGALAGFAMILESIDRNAEALEVYRQVLELAPASPPMKEAVERLEMKQEGRTL